MKQSEKIDIIYDVTMKNDTILGQHIIESAEVRKDVKNNTRWRWYITGGLVVLTVIIGWVVTTI